LQEIEPIVDAIHSSRRPVLYVGGGCLDCPDELRELVARTGIPVAQTLMGLGAFPESDPLALQVHLCILLAFLAYPHLGMVAQNIPDERSMSLDSRSP